MEMMYFNIYQHLRDCNIPAAVLDEIFSDKKDLDTLSKSWETLKAEGLNGDEIAKEISKIIINEVIRNHMNFKGLLISDDISMKSLKYSLEENALKALHAGCNLVLHCNGNIREMLSMFRKNIQYIIKNRNEFTEVNNGNINFTRENVLKLYYDDEQNECCKIIDINNPHRKTGYSLYYNILLAVADKKIIDEDFMDIFESDLKFKRKDIINAIRILSNNQHRLLYPTSISPDDKKHSVDPKIVYRAYNISSRGEAYISNLKSWESYIRRVGEIEDIYSQHIFSDSYIQDR